MPQEKLIAIAIDAVLVLVVLALLAWFGRGALGFLQAPAKLDAALGINAAQHEAAVGQNASIDGLAKAATEKKAVSRAARDAAGNEELARAQAIQGKPAAGTTAIERAANRINSEFATQ